MEDLIGSSEASQAFSSALKQPNLSHALRSMNLQSMTAMREFRHQFRQCCTDSDPTAREFVRSMSYKLKDTYKFLFESVCAMLPSQTNTVLEKEWNEESGDIWLLEAFGIFGTEVLTNERFQEQLHLLLQQGYSFRDLLRRLAGEQQKRQKREASDCNNVAPKEWKLSDITRVLSSCGVVLTKDEPGRDRLDGLSDGELNPVHLALESLQEGQVVNATAVYLLLNRLNPDADTNMVMESCGFLSTNRKFCIRWKSMRQFVFCDWKRLIFPLHHSGQPGSIDCWTVAIIDGELAEVFIYDPLGDDRLWRSSVDTVVPLLWALGDNLPRTKRWAFRSSGDFLIGEEQRGFEVRQANNVAQHNKVTIVTDVLQPYHFPTCNDSVNSGIYAIAVAVAILHGQRSLPFVEPSLWRRFLCSTIATDGLLPNPPETILEQTRANVVRGSGFYFDRSAGEEDGASSARQHLSQEIGAIYERLLEPVTKLLHDTKLCVHATRAKEANSLQKFKLYDRISQQRMHPLNDKCNMDELNARMLQIQRSSMYRVQQQLPALYRGIICLNDMQQCFKDHVDTLFENV